MTKAYTDLEVRVREFARKVTTREEGAGMVEYALLVALIGVTLVTILGALALAIGGTFQEAINQL
jgi:Flp pilus assembly pilin Flp